MANTVFTKCFVPINFFRMMTIAISKILLICVMVVIQAIKINFESKNNLTDFRNNIVSSMKRQHNPVASATIEKLFIMGAERQWVFDFLSVFFNHY